VLYNVLIVASGLNALHAPVRTKHLWLLKRRYTQLSSEDRFVIRKLLSQRFSVRKIAAILEKHRSTVFREIRRNTNARGVYDPLHAQGFLRERRLDARSKFRKIENDPQFEMNLVALLKEDHSPEQIVGRKKLLGLPFPVCFKTIYAWVHRGWQQRKLLLHFQGRHRLARGERKNAWEPEKRHITERPKNVEKRTRAGDWEGDLVHGSQDDSRHAILTLVDRASGVNVMRKVQTLKPRVIAEIVRLALKGRPVHTITFDNGVEFAHHKTMEKTTGSKVYFTDVRSPQQRGSNENFNGLLRRPYYPKGESLRHITQEHVDGVSDRLNSRPRKRLGFRTPREVFAELAGVSKYTLKRRRKKRR
jgi:transposase, IS30 family